MTTARPTATSPTCRRLYGMLAEIRERYPDLLIENVSSGGNRIDFGVLALLRQRLDGRSHGAGPPRAAQPAKGSPRCCRRRISCPSSSITTRAPLARRHPDSSPCSCAAGCRASSASAFARGCLLPRIGDEIAQAIRDLSAVPRYRSRTPTRSLLTDQVPPQPLPVDGTRFETLNAVTRRRVLVQRYAVRTTGQRSTVVPTAGPAAGRSTYGVQSPMPATWGRHRSGAHARRGRRSCRRPGTQAHILIIRRQ